MTPKSCTPDLFTRREAIAFCRVSPATFDRHVRPAVTPVRPLYPLRFRRADLEAWMFGGDSQSSDAGATPYAGPRRARLPPEHERVSLAERQRQARAVARGDVRPEPSSLAELREQLRAATRNR